LSFCRHIDNNKAKYIKNLSDAVAIKSVSAWADTRPEIFKMMEWAKVRLEALGATTSLRDVGEQVRNFFLTQTEFQKVLQLINKKIII